MPYTVDRWWVEREFVARLREHARRHQATDRRTTHVLLGSLMSDDPDVLEADECDAAGTGNGPADGRDSGSAEDGAFAAGFAQDLSVFEAGERLKAEIEDHQLEALARMHAAAEAELAARAGQSWVGRTPFAAREAVVLEVSAATGLPEGELAVRVDLATGPARRVGFLREQVRTGATSLRRACAVLAETTALDDAGVDAVARAVLAPTRDGAGLTGTLFRSRLRRALVAAATADKSGTVRQRRIRERVGVFGQVFDDGTGSLTVVNDAEKIAAALDRADAAARAARAQGDPRTLDALRADFMTGAAIHGWPGGTGCITGCGNASGGVGIGRGEPSEAGSADRRGTGSKDGRGGSGDGSGNPRGAGSVVRGRDGRGDRSGDRNGPASGDERQAGRGDGLADRIGDGNGNGRGDGRGDGSGDGSGDLRWDGRGETGFGFAPAPAGRVFVVVPWSTAAGLDDVPCELPGHGWVTAEHARRIITTDGSIWQTLLADPDTGRALSLSAKGYRPTRAIVEHVRAVDGICRGPGCQRPARQCDLDHDRTWPDGPTDVDNLTAKHRAHHRVRTAGWWTADRDEDAILTWRTAAGRTYITRPKDWLDGHRPTEPATAPDVARTHPPPSDESPGRPPGLPSGESPGQWSASSAVESSGPSGGQSSQPSAVQPRPRSAGGAAATHDPPPF